jgi:plastocyanin
MRKVASALMLAALLALAACGGGGTAGSGGNTISMGNSDFSPANPKLTIKVGDTVKFVDPSTGGGSHILVIGTNGQAQPQAGAPTDLNTTSGVQFGTGDTKSYTFSMAGTYHITCTVHPVMNATITVNP